MISIPSPCISLCQMDAPSGLCKGCWRSIDEIMAWGRLDDVGKQQVWLQIAQRKKDVVFNPNQPTMQQKY